MIIADEMRHDRPRGAPALGAGERHGRIRATDREPTGHDGGLDTSVIPSGLDCHARSAARNIRSGHAGGFAANRSEPEPAGPGFHATATDDQSKSAGSGSGAVADNGCPEPASGA